MKTLCMASAVLACLAFANAAAAADDPYPDWTGQWSRPVGRASFDPALPATDQKIPFTPEAQAYFDKVVADRQAGGLKDNFSTSCVPLGMPRVTIDYEVMDVIVTPSTTYMWFTESNELRRIYTDGRSWPKQIEPSYLGYSIGEWRDEGHTGHYDTLVVETRGFRGPRVFDSTGTPLNRDNESVFKERYFTEASNPRTIHHEITTYDHNLTRPYTVNRTYVPSKQKWRWTETLCALDTSYLMMGDATYFISGDGYLMPSEKGQRPPDLRYFSRATEGK